ncbi:DUF3095 domain-containing protein [Chachezhania sediminis]|uniref:DUF3095 domain-containing protein n=1 Tax=Chachezhania sediminis TaxID=2599291 RepID=UPI0018EEEDAA|nr:DUF3095 domain-containing protein [Chachezhania sediminis]
MSSTEAFFASLPLHEDFATLSDAHIYAPLPKDWWVATSDITGSTQAVADGRYKTVNMVGAAVISAQMNAHKGKPFPFIFGGDGAGFAVPPEWRDRTEEALLAVKAWAQTEFDMDLRVGMTPIADIRAAGLDVTVARFQASEGVDYAMFSGGGMSWAEAQMKAGAQITAQLPEGTKPDLTGLSCRWSHMPSQHGVILSVVILPSNGVPSPTFSTFVQRVLRVARRLPSAGHPAEASGPDVKWPPAGATLEAHAQRGDGTLGAARRRALFESFVAWLLIKTGLKLGGFDARRYRRVVGENADYRKFGDGLKMTLDCDPDTERKLRGLLEQGAADGIVRFGLHAQSEAMMTCIVPSILADNHVHFVDGASGGYTAAAKSIKHGTKA